MRGLCLGHLGRQTLKQTLLLNSGDGYWINNPSRKMKHVHIALAFAVGLIVAGGAALLWIFNENPELSTPSSIGSPGQSGSVSPLPQNGNPLPSGGTGSSGTPKAGIWERTIAGVIMDDKLTNDQAAAALMEVARNPNAPDQQRLDALEHAINLLSDDIYSEEILALVKSGRATNEQLETVIFSLHDRSGKAQLVTALSIAQINTTPIAEEAFDLLSFMVETEDDLGKDWDRWGRAVEQQLAEQQ